MNRGNNAFVHFLAAAALGFCLLATPGFAQEKKNEAGRAGSESGEGDLVRKRQEWFYRQRAYPLGHIPAGARQRALEDKEIMRREQRQRLSQAASTPGAARNAAVRGTPGANAPSLTKWTAIGPMPTSTTSPAQMGVVSGRVSALAVDPTNANTIFLGAAQGGVWKSIDGGVTWSTTFDDAKSLAIGALAIDPSSPANARIVYAGTGEENFAQDAYYGAGIYKSTDGGVTWTQTLGIISNPAAGSTVTSFNGPFNEVVGGVHVGAIAVHPSRIFAAVQVFQNFDGGAASGIFCSEDGGDHWTRVLGGAIGTDIAIHTMSGMGYAALGSPNGDSFTPSSDPTGQNGVYSANVGLPCAQQVWTLKSKAPMPTGINAGRIRLDVAASDPTGKTVYAAVADGTSGSKNSAGVFQSTDGGTNWTPLSPLPSGSNFCGQQCFFDMVIKVHPNDANTVFLGGSGGGVTLQRWTKSSGAWTDITSAAIGELHVDLHAIAFGFPGGGATNLVVGNDGGVWTTSLAAPTSAVTNWVNLNQTLQITQFYTGLSIHPTDARIAYAGAQDNGTQKLDQSAVTPLQWTDQSVCGDGGYTAIDPAMPTTVYAACQDIDIHKSINAGASWTTIDGGITQSEFSEFIPPLVIDPNPATSQRLYFGTFHVWQTIDGGMNWNVISPGNLTLDNTQFGVTSISVAPSNTSIVYAGTFDSRLWRTTQANLGPAAIPNWQQIGTLPGRAITQVAADPNNPDIVFVTMSGFSGFIISPSTTIDTQGHVFRCSAVSGTCTDISGTGSGVLPNVPVNTIVVDPGFASSNTLYIGTDVGVFGTTDGGNTWIADYPGGANGFPDVAVFGLTLHPASRILRAVTHGRGAWDLQLPVIPPTITSISPPSAPAGASNVSLTVAGTNFTANSTVLFNGLSHVPTATPTAATIIVNLTAADLAVAGNATVQVSDPVNGTSNTVTFVITTPAPVATLSPTSLSFGNVVRGAASASQTVTLTNSGNAALVIGGITVTGANPGDFGQTNTCPASLAASANCVITVIFTPSTSGAESASLTIADNASGSPQTVGLMGTGATDFTISANPTSATVSRGNSAATTLSLAPVPAGAQYPGNVTFACSGLPTEAACVFTPATVLQAAGAATVSLSVSTRAPSMIPPAPRRGPGGAPWGMPLWALAGLASTGWFVLRHASRRWRYAFSLAMVLMLAGLAMACGGGGGGGVVHDPGTPVGAFPITATATSGGVSHAVTFTVTVQ